MNQPSTWNNSNVEILRKFSVSIRLFPLVLHVVIKVAIEAASNKAPIREAVRSLIWLAKNLNSNSLRDLKLLIKFRKDNFYLSLFQFGSFKSQIGQDVLVTSILNGKRNGYFVEFGATNGIDLSNTHLLETHFGWNGILAEPARIWHEDLRINRNANISTKCVWHNSNETIEFNETQSPELSTINSYSKSDFHAASRTHGVTYKVDTISLNELLENFQAPRYIDYLSIDTEGSEYEILNALDFSIYSFGIITCEHNGTIQRDQIFKLLTTNGYIRILTDFSMFDDWYVNANLLVSTEKLVKA